MGGKFKIVIFGDEMSGKKALSKVSMRKSTQSVETYQSTIGVEYVKKILDLGRGTTHKISNKNENDVTLQIWCAGGQERYRNIVSPYAKGTAAFIIAVDLTSEKSIEGAVKPWMDMVTQKYPDKSSRPPIILVGTKSDSLEVKSEKIQALQAYAQTNNYPCYITSSQTNTCVDVSTNQTGKVDHFADHDSTEDASTNEVGTEDTLFMKVARICVAKNKQQDKEEAKAEAKAITYQELYDLANNYLNSWGNKSVHSRALADFILRLTSGKTLQHSLQATNSSNSI